MALSKELELEKRKIVFQFALMLVASVVGGICFSKLLGENIILSLTERISLHFSEQLPKIGALAQLFTTLIRITLPDFICIGILFACSFSFVNYIISDAVLVFAGFRFGLNAALIKLAGISVIGVGNSLSFWLLRGVMLPILLIFSCKMAFYSLKLRRSSSANGRIVFDKRATLSMLFLTFTTAIAAFAINLLYCIFIYIF